MKRRRGIGLIETATAVTLGSALLALGVGILHLLIEMDQRSQSRLRDHAAVFRLGEQFREDAHAAQYLEEIHDAAAGPEGSVWRFHVDVLHDVKYVAEDGLLIRIERARAEVQRQESYALPPGARVSMKSASGLATLVLSPDPAEARQPEFRPVRIEAAMAPSRVRELGQEDRGPRR